MNTEYPLLHGAKYGLADAIAHNARICGGREAIVEEGFFITYSSLDARAKDLATTLLKQGLGYEDTVGILTSFGARHVIAQVAVVYAGGTCLPLDGSHLDDDLRARLSVAEVKYLIVDDNHRDRTLSVQHVVNIGIQPIDSPDFRSLDSLREVHSSYRSHIFFTSGTTGRPKAVQVPAAGILRVANDPVCGAISGEERVAHINNPCFDVSLIDIWGSLLNGATIVVLDRKLLVDPELFGRSLKEKRITYAFIPTALFHVIALSCPTAFSGLSTLIVGGEALSAEPCRVVLQSGPPARLINGYGPTECTVLSHRHIVTAEDVAAGHIPIGQPLLQTSEKVLDEALEEVTGDAPGELCLGGRGVSTGYLNDQKATQNAFITMPASETGADPVRIYRTGDLVCRDGANNLIWLGRKDREVKIRGHRVALDIVETELLHTGLVDAAIAIKVTPPGSSSAILVACITYRSPDASDDKLLAAARARLPSYMVPQPVTFEKMPMTAHGKVDRKQAREDLMHLLRDREANVESQTSSIPASTETRLRALWSRVLVTVHEENIRSESNFFNLGATSLHVASLIPLARKVLGIQLSYKTVYENPTLSGLAEVIQKKTTKTFAEQVEETKALMRKDVSTLGKDIFIPTDPPVNWRSSNEGNIFLTGATGFIGAFMLLELLRIPEVKTVRCLIRADRPQSAFAKLYKNLDKYRLRELVENYKEKIEVVPGDFAENNLGMNMSSYLELADWASAVYHIGAQVNFNEPYSASRTPNVLGTMNILRFVATGKPKALHYASTISVFGPTGLIRDEVSIVDENTSITPFLDSVMPYEVGYGQTKWVVDEIVLDLMRHGFPATIYRLGFVLCNSETGVCNPDDFLSRWLEDCIRLGKYPLLPDMREEVLPIDYVSSAIKTISMSNENLGQVYHIVPDIPSSMDMNPLFCTVGKHAGVEMTGLSYPDWLEVIQRELEGGSELRLKPLLPMLEEKVLGELTRVEVYKGMARFKQDNTATALTRTKEWKSLRGSAINEADLKPYVQFLMAEG